MAILTIFTNFLLFTFTTIINTNTVSDRTIFSRSPFY